MAIYLAGRAAARRVRGALMVESRLTRTAARGSGAARRAVHLDPAADHPASTRSTRSNIAELADPGLHDAAGSAIAWHDQEVRSALWLSLQGRARRDRRSRSCSGRWRPLAVARFRFFGREAISFLLILPLALPGMITGIALSAFYTTSGASTSALWTIVIGHATFCIVDRLQQRRSRGCGAPRRRSIEASMDLGADGWQTFRFVTFPVISTALVSGGAARVRALLRRGDRDDLHRRRAEHAADLDLRQDPPRPAAARGERGRLRRDRADGDPGDRRAAAGAATRGCCGAASV